MCAWIMDEGAAHVARREGLPSVAPYDRTSWGKSISGSLQCGGGAR